MGKLESLPPYMETLLQGLSFWVGLEKAYYPYHNLLEGAIQGEACNLLASRLSSNEVLLSEIYYEKILLTKKGCKHTLKGKRVDLVVQQRGDQHGSIYSEDPNRVSTLIELKRFPGNPWKEDCVRLADYLRCHGGRVRCFLLVVSQGKIPTPFVDVYGRAKNTYVWSIKKSGTTVAYARVRRACVALWTKNVKLPKQKGPAKAGGYKPECPKLRTGHFACLLEVYACGNGNNE